MWDAKQNAKNICENQRDLRAIPSQTSPENKKLEDKATPIQHIPCILL